MTQSFHRPALPSHFLVFLLWLLRNLVQLHEKVDKWLKKPLSYLGTISNGGIKAKRRGAPPKFPTAVALIIAEGWGDPECLDCLSSLIHWTTAAGIRRLQLYERSGQLKAISTKLQARINFLADSYTIKVGWQADHHEDKSGPFKVEGRNGDACILNSCTSVTLLSEEDGRQPLLQAIRRDYLLKGNGAKVTGELLTQQLEAAVGPQVVALPDLIWVFGSVLTLAGFPPWLVRHSEIHHMGKLADVKQDCVHRALQKYCQTSQRFGQ